ncbi:hypothetical protein Tco_0492634 [Tanacetum coccineum]
MRVEESLNVTFDEKLPLPKTLPLEDDDLVNEEAIEVNKTRPLVQEELNQFVANAIWELVPNPKNMTIIGTKWVYRNKLDENGVVSRNKASLPYLMASRTDMMFSVCLCARFQEDPKTSHLEAVKRIFRYIKGTMHLGLWYPKGSDIEIIVYADSDHAGDYMD